MRSLVQHGHLRGGRTSSALPCMFLHRTTPSEHSKVWLLKHGSCRHSPYAHFCHSQRIPRSIAFMWDNLMLLIKHLETDARHVQILTQTRNVWPKTEPRLKDWCHVLLCALFAKVSFIACDCLVTSVPLLCAPHLHTLKPVSSLLPTENLINHDTGWNTTFHKMRHSARGCTVRLFSRYHARHSSGDQWRAAFAPQRRL